MLKTMARVFCFGAVVAWSSAGFAASTYVTQVSVVPTGFPPAYDSGTAFAFGSVFQPVNVLSAPGIVLSGDSVGDGRASAGLGALGVYARSAQGLQGGTLGYYANVINTESRAEFTLDDVVITPLVPGNPQTFVNLVLRFAMVGMMADPTVQGGVFDTASIANFPFETFASVDNQLYLDVDFRDPAGTFSGAGGGWARVRSFATYAAGSTTPERFTTGSLAGQAGALQGGFPFIAEALFIGVPVGRPLELKVGLRAITQSAAGFPAGGGEWQGNGVVAFDNTLTFATDAVATLPAGFTLNSASGGIVDNTWTPVPLPGTLLLLATGFLGVFARRVRRDNR